jgi:hypothetical protein
MPVEERGAAHVLPIPEAAVEDVAHRRGEGPSHAGNTTPGVRAEVARRATAGTSGGLPRAAEKTLSSPTAGRAPPGSGPSGPAQRGAPGAGADTAVGSSASWTPSSPQGVRCPRKRVNSSAPRPGPLYSRAFGLLGRRLCTSSRVSQRMALVCRRSLIPPCRESETTSEKNELALTSWRRAVRKEARRESVRSTDRPDKPPRSPAPWHSPASARAPEIRPRGRGAGLPRRFGR